METVTESGSRGQEAERGDGVGDTVLGPWPQEERVSSPWAGQHLTRAPLTFVELKQATL